MLIPKADRKKIHEVLSIPHSRESFNDGKFFFNIWKLTRIPDI